MADVELEKITLNVRLINGTDASGNNRYVKVSLGNLDESEFSGTKRDASLTKALEVVKALEPIFDKTISYLEAVENSIIEGSE